MMRETALPGIAPNTINYSGFAPEVEGESLGVRPRSITFP
jgi:hypothetical protein